MKLIVKILGFDFEPVSKVQLLGFLLRSALASVLGALSGLCRRATGDKGESIRLLSLGVEGQVSL